MPTPLTLTRPLAGFPLGLQSLGQHQAQWRAAGLEWVDELWLAPADLARLLGARAAGQGLVLVDDLNQPLAWTPTGGAETTDAAPTVELAEASFMIRHPWDLLRAHEQAMDTITTHAIEGEVHPLAAVEGTLRLGPGSRLLPGVYIEGTVVIGSNCKIGPNCHLRGATRIGDGCHIGQSVEIKNSLILDRTHVGHLSYVGDSILGEKVNFGAGTTTSNLRHDGANHRSEVNGQLVDTGRRKFGTIVGDGVHTGIHTSIYPGRKLWPGTTTRPGEIVQRDVGPSVR